MNRQVRNFGHIRYIKYKPMKSGINLIAEERVEQFSKHGFDLYHDEFCNSSGELVAAATIIANMETFTVMDWSYRTNWHVDRYYHIKKKTKIEQLTIAAALLAAEIDRLNAKQKS